MEKQRFEILHFNQIIWIFGRNVVISWSVIAIIMTTTQRIINYASMMGGSFRRMDLLKNLAGQDDSVNARLVDTQINRLVAAGKLQKSGWGAYTLAEDSLPEFLYYPVLPEKELFHGLKKEFPFLDFCVWSPKVLAPMMIHVPNIGYTFVDVEKDGMESVFHSLQRMNTGRNILLSPSETDCERYLTGTDSIVVRQLVGRSPVTEVDTGGKTKRAWSFFT